MVCVWHKKSYGKVVIWWSCTEQSLWNMCIIWVSQKKTSSITRVPLHLHSAGHSWSGRIQCNEGAVYEDRRRIPHCLLRDGQGQLWACRPISSTHTSSQRQVGYSLAARYKAEMSFFFSCPIRAFTVHIMIYSQRSVFKLSVFFCMLCNVILVKSFQSDWHFD